MERDTKIGKLSSDVAMQQKLEILAALKKLGESLQPLEEAFLQTNGSSSLKQFEKVTGDIGKYMFLLWICFYIFVDVCMKLSCN